MTSREKELYVVIREVRTCFNQLKTLAEQLHRNLGVNPSMRAVMEALANTGEQTVPEIAKSKGVSRQHIQTIMNSLLMEGYVDTFDNPVHKRSPLFDLTQRGRETFAQIEEKEKKPLRRLAAAMSPEPLEIVGTTLAKLNEQLAEEVMKGEKREKSS